MLLKVFIKVKHPETDDSNGNYLNKGAAAKEKKNGTVQKRGGQKMTVGLKKNWHPNELGIMK